MRLSPRQCRSQKFGHGLTLLFLSMFLTACASTLPERAPKTVVHQPSQSLLLQAAVPDWPATLTNGELLTLARSWRSIALECNADKASIEAEAKAAIATVPTELPATESPRSWWPFWR